MTPLLRYLERRMSPRLALWCLGLIYALLLVLILTTLGQNQDVIRYIDPRRP